MIDLKSIPFDLNTQDDLIKAYIMIFFRYPSIKFDSSKAIEYKKAVKDYFKTSDNSSKFDKKMKNIYHAISKEQNKKYVVNIGFIKNKHKRFSGEINVLKNTILINEYYCQPKVKRISTLFHENRHEYQYQNILKFLCDAPINDYDKLVAINHFMYSLGILKNDNYSALEYSKYHNAYLFEFDSIYSSIKELHKLNKKHISKKDEFDINVTIVELLSCIANITAETSNKINVFTKHSAKAYKVQVRELYKRNFEVFKQQTKNCDVKRKVIDFVKPYFITDEKNMCKFDKLFSQKINELICLTPYTRAYYKTAEEKVPENSQ